MAEVQRSAPSEKGTTQGWHIKIYFKHVLFSVEEPKGAVTVAREGLGESPGAVTAALSTAGPPPREALHSPHSSVSPHAAASPPREPSGLPSYPSPFHRTQQPSPQPSLPHPPSQASPARSSHLPASPLSSHHRSRTLHLRLLACPPALHFLPQDWLSAAWPRLPPVAIGPCARAAVRRGAARWEGERQRRCYWREGGGLQVRLSAGGERGEGAIVAGSPRRGAGGHRGRAARRGPSGSHEWRRVWGRWVRRRLTCLSSPPPPRDRWARRRPVRQRVRASPGRFPPPRRSLRPRARGAAARFSHNSAAEQEPSWCLRFLDAGWQHAWGKGGGCRPCLCSSRRRFAEMLPPATGQAVALGWTSAAQVPGGQRRPRALETGV